MSVISRKSNGGQAAGVKGGGGGGGKQRKGRRGDGCRRRVASRINCNEDIKRSKTSPMAGMAKQVIKGERKEKRGEKKKEVHPVAFHLHFRGA